jgi:hypothetical protein
MFEKEGTCVSVSCFEMLKALKGVLPMAAHGKDAEEGSPHLCQVHVEAGHVVATNGHCLAVYEMTGMALLHNPERFIDHNNLTDEPDEGFTLAIPHAVAKRMVAELSEVCKAEDKAESLGAHDIELWVDRGWYEHPLGQLRFDNQDLGPFPDWRKAVVQPDGDAMSPCPANAAYIAAVMKCFQSAAKGANGGLDKGVVVSVHLPDVSEEGTPGPMMFTSKHEDVEGLAVYVMPVRD